VSVCQVAAVDIDAEAKAGHQSGSDPSQEYPDLRSNFSALSLLLSLPLANLRSPLILGPEVSRDAYSQSRCRLQCRGAR